MTLPCSSNEFNFFLIVSFTFFADYNFTCTEENSQKNYSTYFTSSSCHGNLQSGVLWGLGGGGVVVEWQAKGKKEHLLPPKEEGKDYHLITDYWHG